MTSEGDSKYLREIIKNSPVMGGKIDSVTDMDEDGFFGINIKCKGGKMIQLVPSCDPEGNGPGFLFVETIGNE